MGLEEFFKRFEGLDERIDRLREENTLAKKAAEKAEGQFKGQEFVRDILYGLRNPPTRDPGKSRTAYYFVSKIGSDNILRSENNEPSLYMPCKCCGEEKPVVMDYSQTYDSPGYDEWRKRAFILCEKDGAHQVKSVTMSERF